MLEKYGVEMIGASREAIDKAEDREKFKEAMAKIGLASPRSALAHSMEEALQVQAMVGFPTIIRPSFTLGGTGGGIAYNREEFVAICERGLDASPTKEVLIEESVIGWKEFEMEVVRDRKDNCIIICSIENLDPMGVHTGDSITVAPAQTLTDKEYQIMRDASIAVLREIGVDTGGSNVQFAHQSGRRPHGDDRDESARVALLGAGVEGDRLSRSPRSRPSSPWATRWTNCATTSPAARRRPRSSRPSITSSPRCRASRSRNSRRPNDRLTTQMKSVGEVMAIGRTFQESLQKALRGLETGADGLDEKTTDREVIENELGDPGPERIWYVADAFRCGMTLEEVHAAVRTSIPGSWRRSRTSCDQERELAGSGSGRPGRARAARSSSATASPTGGWPSC